MDARLARARSPLGYTTRASSKRTACTSMILHARRGGRPLLPATLPETEAERSSSLDPTQQVSWRAHCMQVRLAAYPRDERIAREATPSQPPWVYRLNVCSACGSAAATPTLHNSDAGKCPLCFPCTPSDSHEQNKGSACALDARPNARRALTGDASCQQLPQGPNTGGLPPLTYVRIPPPQSNWLREFH